MSFHIHALPSSLAKQMFALSEQELLNLSAKKVMVDAFPGYPCRISLEDARIGESMILFNYPHQPNASPFRSSHAIFVREGAKQASLKAGEVPQSFKVRPISLRAFNTEHDMLDPQLAQGEEVAEMIEQLLAGDGVSYLHLHYAKPGCFAASVTW